MRTLTGATGSVTARMAYDPYGVPLPRASSPSSLGYTGELTDPTTGLVYLHARYYDPQLGVFTSRDPVEAVYRRSGRHERGSAAAS